MKVVNVKVVNVKIVNVKVVDVKVVNVKAVNVKDLISDWEEIFISLQVLIHRTYYIHTYIFKYYDLVVGKAKTMY